jgi:hypothetical protein
LAAKVVLSLKRASRIAFPRWRGARLVVTLSQGTPWLLVLRADLPARRGDIGAVKGVRIAAAPGPDRAFLRLPAEVGLDPARETAVRRGLGRGRDAVAGLWAGPRAVAATRSAQ